MARRKRSSTTPRKTARVTPSNNQLQGKNCTSHLTYTEQMSIVIGMLSAAGVTVAFWALSLVII